MKKFKFVYRDVKGNTFNAVKEFESAIDICDEISNSESEVIAVFNENEQRIY